MKYSNCITCGVEKTGQGVLKARCRSCACKARCEAEGQTISPVYLHCSECGKEKTGHQQGRSKCFECGVKNRYDANARLGLIRYPGLARWTRLIKQRDGECVHCHSKDQLAAHHLLRKEKFPQFATELWNGLTLCKPCHKITHGKL